MSKSGRPREFEDTTVIDAAMEVFWKNGYEACSTDDLCKGTGLGRGSLYNAFGSKHELYEQALLRYHRAGIDAQIDILRRPGRLRERLRALLEWAIREDFSDAGRRGCLIINAAMERAQKDPAVERIFKQHVDRLGQALSEAIEEGRNAGEVPSGRRTSELAALFLSSYYGLRVLNAAAQNRGMADQVAEGVLNVLN
ncbi:TetR/AcrR family transcriptional regulator [Cohnella zeiphila]|uniref:TetR/AcrR family transcriptional regulator n=1 Tax=Cohnella zeiphila TaxID=2761120 RepID=A0A7X0SHY0_9BACL|nr:TetR/AcrR family transcriptional regulator [Cohnella zeiphila]MBB6730196.1 TetR/AcrR family transcriptional regulator [Cohnella zeiphila]